jgi:hypothetical protein
MNPVSSALRASVSLLQGRAHFPSALVGRQVQLDGRQFVVFRQVIVDRPGAAAESAGAVFIPRFRLSGMSPRANERFSWLPIPFFIGLPGFRSKLWLVARDTGEFAGIYEWDKPEDAERYARSFAAHFMTARAEPGSVSFRVFPRGETLPFSLVPPGG